MKTVKAKLVTAANLLRVSLLKDLQPCFAVLETANSGEEVDNNDAWEAAEAMRHALKTVEDTVSTLKSMTKDLELAYDPIEDLSQGNEADEVRKGFEAVKRAVSTVKKMK